LRQVHPLARIHLVPDTLGDDDTLAWATFTVEFLGFVPDAVFSSEDYGEPYARAMGSRSVLVDRDRRAVPCSGTQIRRQPWAMRGFLHPLVRAWYTWRICLVGAESTGKTTLAQALARHFGVAWMPEYGREYCERKYGLAPFAPDGDPVLDDWASEEFLAIAQEHARREDEAAARAEPPLLIVDTDAFATCLWHERYLGGQEPTLEALAEARRPLYRLYLLCGSDIPWVQDGTRDGRAIRETMQGRFRQRLEASGRPWLAVSGSPEQRLAQACRAIEGLLAEAPEAWPPSALSALSAP
jgi:NadR type nicotinamide-nucleotide adenylyltransferase